MQYGRELREKWRFWVGAALGLSVGSGTQAFTSGLFAPHMIAEFGWSRAQFALQGTLTLAMFLIIPIVGRLTDTLGARRVAAFGVIFLPLAYVAFSLQTGSIYLFFVLSAVKSVVGATTVSIVYCRIVALSFTAARGLALAICASAPALLMALSAPLLGGFIESHGWRAGYQALAVVSALIGLIAVLIIPSQRDMRMLRKINAAGSETPASASGGTRSDYGKILRNPTFWIIFSGMFLCNIPSAIVGAQFGLMLLDQGADFSRVPWLISLYTTSVVVGRFICGLSLDRLPSYLVAATSLAMPAIGLLLLGSQLDLMGIIALSVAFVGLAQGAEGDLVAYLIARYFPKDIFGSVAGLVSAGMALSSVLGAVIISICLYLTDSFLPFLQLTGILTIIGAFLFTGLRNRQSADGAAWAGEQLVPKGEIVPCIRRQPITQVDA